jgi:MFS family permease
MIPESHKVRMLWLCGVLHAFTHIYHVALIPLYFPIQRGLKLGSVGQATLLQTVLMLSYFVPSYWLGVLADRLNRRKLLAAGLAINGLGFVGLALSPDFASALACVVVAGLGGCFYHPAATALIARLYPVGTGRALGLVGIGAGVGFFVAPIYVGWRAESAGWRAPLLELGLAGLVVAGFFYVFAEEETGPAREPGGYLAPMFPSRALWFWFVAASLLFSVRDFAGSSIGTLGSLFMQQARGFGVQQTGMTLSAIFLAAVVSNPFFGGLSDRGRLRWTAFVLVVAALAIAVFPHVGPAWFVPMLALYGFFFMASYPMVEAALMESVPDAVRGRIYGFFITVGGLVGNLSHWAVGHYVETLGTGAGRASSYYDLYAGLSILVLVSLLGLPCLRAIRRREHDLAGTAA